MSNLEHTPSVEARESTFRNRMLIALGIGSAAVVTGGAFAANGESVECDRNVDVCLPGVTAPPDEEYVPGNPVPGETIPIDEEFDDKGPTTSTTTTTVPETTTTTTVPETTTTTTTTAPATTTTVPAATTTTVVVTTAPPTLPPITVPVETVPQVTE